MATILLHIIAMHAMRGFPGGTPILFECWLCKRVFVNGRQLTKTKSTNTKPFFLDLVIKTTTKLTI